MWLVFFLNLKYVILKPQSSFNGFVFYFTAFVSSFSKVMGLTEKSFHVLIAILYCLQKVSAWFGLQIFNRHTKTTSFKSNISFGGILMFQTKTNKKWFPTQPKRIQLNSIGFWSVTLKFVQLSWREMVQHALCLEPRQTAVARMKIRSRFSQLLAYICKQM